MNILKYGEKCKNTLREYFERILRRVRVKILRRENTEKREY